MASDEFKTRAVEASNKAYAARVEDNAEQERAARKSTHAGGELYPHERAQKMKDRVAAQPKPLPPEAYSPPPTPAPLEIDDPHGPVPDDDMGTVAMARGLETEDPHTVASPDVTPTGVREHEDPLHIGKGTYSYNHLLHPTLVQGVPSGRMQENPGGWSLDGDISDANTMWINRDKRPHARVKATDSPQGTLYSVNGPGGSKAKLPPGVSAAAITAAGQHKRLVDSKWLGAGGLPGQHAAPNQFSGLDVGPPKNVQAPDDDFMGSRVNARNLELSEKNMSDLKKAGPPPLPPGAFKNPSPQAAPSLSPWDEEVIASAPKPSPARAQAGPPSWLGKPITHKDHIQGLEMDSAVNEFSNRMPRQQAEEKAYGDYTKQQQVEAAAHHLAGARAAHAAGDMESARKHSVMYNVHSKALGHEPVGPAHPAVTAHLAKEPGQVKFKAHRGDLFAVQPPKVIASSPPPEAMGKAETLQAIWQGARRALAKADQPLNKSDINAWAKSELALRKKEKSKVVPCRCDAYTHPHRTGGGRCSAGK